MTRSFRSVSATLVVLCALGSLLGAPRGEAAERYVLDPEHVAVTFRVMHIGYANVLGVFREVSGHYTFDEQSGELSDVRIEIATESVDTFHKKRDHHLRGKDFLNVKKFPKMIFSAENAVRDGERDFTVNGELELLGQTQPVTLALTWNKSARYPFGHSSYTMGVSGHGSFRRSEFGMTYGVANDWVGDEVQITIDFEAIQQ